MASRSYTSDQLCDAIAKALKAGDFDAVVGLLHLLAVCDPRRAQLILDAVQVLSPP